MVQFNDTRDVPLVSESEDDIRKNAVAAIKFLRRNDAMDIVELLALDRLGKDMPLGRDEINNRFGFHRSTLEGPNATMDKHRFLRIAFRDFAEWLDQHLPEGRDKSIAMTELESASMWSHKAIAKTGELIGEELENADG